MTAPAAHPRLSLNQATIKRAPLDAVLRLCLENDIRSVGLWRESIAELGLAEAAARITDSGLRVSSLCRGGFLTASEGPSRRESLEKNRRAIAETATLAEAGATGSAAVLVLVVGGLPHASRDLVGARERVGDAIGELAPDAADAGVTLAIEPLHPMYASDRAVVSTLGQAVDIAVQFPAEQVGVVVDAFHVWWDPDLDRQVARAGAAGRIAAYQVCDWATPLPVDVLLGRHLPGDGIIDLAGLTAAVETAGYAGDIEVEVFNQDIWDADWDEVVRDTVETFGASVGAHLPAGR